MKAKRILSAMLTLLMLVSVVASYPITGSATTASLLVTDTNPAIPADAGEAIDLSAIGVELDDTTTLDAGDITWTRGDQTITSFTPESKGVYELIATVGENSKTVYVVAKNPDETEYVLYENDFSGTLDDLKNEGWVFLNESATGVSDGVLHLGNVNGDYYRAILPAWLGDFGDYGITVNSNQTNVKDAARWSSIVYRIENENGKYFPYYHMCVRANTTNSTVEFAERTAGDAWNVIYKNSETLNMTVEGSYHDLTVCAFENTVEYKIDGESVMYVSDATAHTKGYIGLNDNFGTMNVNSVRVTLQMEAPERPVEVPKLIDTSANRTETNIANYVSNHAHATVDTVDALLAAETYPVAVLLDLTGKTVTQEQLEGWLNSMSEKNIIPEFKLDTKTQVDLLAQAIGAAGVPEALVASSDAEIVKYARTKNKNLIRAAYDLSGLTSDRLSADEIYQYYEEAAGAYAQAIILPYQLATKENVADMQEYELAVWAFGTGIDTDSEAAWLIASGANAVISDNWSKVDTVQAEVFTAENSITRTPVWTGHRGYPAKYPENSVSSCLGAIADGADCVEIDVKLSSDGYVVVMHDDTIDRTTNGKGNIMNMKLEEIKTYKLRKYSNGPVTEESIPTFEEVLQALQGKDIKILCEFKSTQSGLTKKCADLIKKYGMEDQVVFICFTPSMLTSIKSYMNTSTGYLLSAPSYVDPLNTVGTLNAYYALQNSTLSYHATMAVNYGNITYEFLRDANDRGITLWSWTYGQSDTANVSKMFIAGMNGMTTDNVGIMKNTVKTLQAPTTVYIAPDGTSSFKIQSEAYNGTLIDVTSKVTVKELENDGVVEIAADGKLTAKKEGKATFIVSYRTSLPNSTKYTLYSQPITVVVGEIPELTLNDGHSYTLENNLLSGVIAETKTEDLLKAFANAEAITVYDDEGNRVTDLSTTIGTGFILSYEGIDTTVIVKGDINGDGEVGARDYMMLKSHVLKKYKMRDTELLAADINGDGDIKASDYMVLKSHVLGKYNIYG